MEAVVEATSLSKEVSVIFLAVIYMQSICNQSMCAVRPMDQGAVHGQWAVPTYWECHPVLSYAQATRVHGVQSSQRQVVQMEGKCCALEMLGHCTVLPVVCAGDSWDDYK